MKPATLNQLLFQAKTSSISFFQAPIKTETEWDDFSNFVLDMEAQLRLQGKSNLAKLIVKNKNHFIKIIKTHPKNSHGFFIAEKFQGYMSLDNTVETYCIIGNSFHVRPILEALFVNPEFMVVNISMYDINVYRGDFQHLEIVKHFEIDQIAKDLEDLQRIYAPKNIGLIPYKTILTLKKIASQVKELTHYHSVPVLITGLEEMKSIFLKYFESSLGVISHVQEDFYEKTCVQIAEQCRAYRPIVVDYYSAQFKDRLKKMVISKRLISDLGEIIRAVSEERVNHLVLPTEKKIWGHIDFSTGEFEVHKKIKKRNPSVDILNELAEEVIKQGGKIQVLAPHFFPQDAYVLAILRG